MRTKLIAREEVVPLSEVWHNMKLTDKDDPEKERIPKMFNRYYSYDNIGLWESEAWAGYYSTVKALFIRIQEINHEQFRQPAHDGPYEGRSDGQYNAKVKSCLYQDYIDGLAEKGMAFRASEMAGVVWAALIPDEVKSGEMRTPKIMAVLGDADFSDPNWMIHVLKKNDPVTEMAARERMALLYLTVDGVNYSDALQGVIQEFSVYYNILPDNLYLDISPLKKAGLMLKDVKGFVYTDSNGNTVDDPDSFEETIGNIPVINISHRWQNFAGGGLDISSDFVRHPLFNREAFIHSPQGAACAASLKIDHSYDTIDNGEFVEYWRRKGLQMESHDFRNYQWISCVPLGCTEQMQGGEKLPVVLIFQEVTYQDPHQPVNAAGLYRGYLELAAAGELIALFFALEDVESNDMFMEIAEEAASMYPIDLSRVYVTGHSHNGYFTERFAMRHHAKVAAIAPLGIHPGLPEPEWTTSPIPVTDEMVEDARTYTMPAIIVTSRAESRNEKLHCRRDDEDFSSAARAWQRRMKANRCHVPSVEEINAPLHDSNPVRAGIGFPVDRAFEEYHSYSPVYIGDVLNDDGKNYLRLAILQNSTHIVSAQMPEISWEFMKRFARDLETGETIELY